MIYRRPIRDVVEERNGRTCGIHVFAFYIIALAAIVGMSTACLTATEGGFFSFVQRITLSKPAVAGMQVDYEVTYGWQSMCSEADVYSIVGGLQDSVYGCFPLGETVTLTDVKSVKLAAGSPMTEETGLAVALGHGVAAAMSAIHVLFFVMLYFNM